MAVLQGKDFTLYVETATPGTYVLVNDINSFSKTASRDNSRFPVFARTTPYSINAPKEASYSAGGFFNPVDAGQQRLRDMEATDTAVKIKVLYDGVNGFTQQVKVTSYEFSAAPDGLQEYGFDLAADADPVIVGAGPIL